MSQRRPSHRFGALDPGAVGRATTRVGVALVAVSVPLLVWTAAGLLADVSTPSAALATLAAASSGPVVAVSDTASIFRVGLYVLLAGCWLLGAGLVLDGLFD
jgi:hypothetical protein